MEPIKCTNCGAPAQVQPGAAQHHCQFCKSTFNVPGVQQERPQSVQIHVIMPGGHRHDSDSPAAAAGAAAGRAIAPIISVVAIVGITSVVGGGFAFKNAAKSVGIGASWDGKAPFECRLNDDVEFKNVKAQFATGSAVIVDGNCHFQCVDCNVKAPVAVSVRGNGHAVFLNGTVEGSEAVADVSNNGSFELRGNATIVGGKPRAKHNGKLIGIPATPPTPPIPAGAPAAAPAKAPAKK